MNTTPTPPPPARTAAEIRGDAEYLFGKLFSKTYTVDGLQSRLLQAVRLIADLARLMPAAAPVAEQDTYDAHRAAGMSASDAEWAARSESESKPATASPRLIDRSAEEVFTAEGSDGCIVSGSGLPPSNLNHGATLFLCADHDEQVDALELLQAYHRTIQSDCAEKVQAAYDEGYLAGLQPPPPIDTAAIAALQADAKTLAGRYLNGSEAAADVYDAARRVMAGESVRAPSPPVADDRLWRAAESVRSAWVVGRPLSGEMHKLLDALCASSPPSSAPIGDRPEVSPWTMTADALPPTGERVLVEVRSQEPGNEGSKLYTVVHGIAAWYVGKERWDDDNWHGPAPRKHVYRWMKIPK